jgi:hypothetical protein
MPTRKHTQEMPAITQQMFPAIRIPLKRGNTNKFERMTSIKSPYFEQPKKRQPPMTKVSSNVIDSEEKLRRMTSSVEISSLMIRKESLSEASQFISFADDTMSTKQMKVEKFSRKNRF